VLFLETPFCIRRFFFAVIFVLLVSRAFYVQVLNGERFLVRSEDNRLHSIPIFAKRGVIEDRNAVPLAFNVFATTTGALTSTSTNEVPRRTYISQPGFSHILGYVSYPKKDKSGVFLAGFIYWTRRFRKAI
jgi:cell division protein FtsI/penicillin-binding protein 2